MKSLTNREMRAVLRTAACQLAAVVNEPSKVTEPTSEACFTGAGAFIVEFRPGDHCSTIKITSISPVVAAEHRKRSKLETDVLRVIAAAGENALKGLTIARRLGREYDSYLRSTLARMVRDGRLGRATNGSGYVLG